MKRSLAIGKKKLSISKTWLSMRPIDTERYSDEM